MATFPNLGADGACRPVLVLYQHWRHQPRPDRLVPSFSSRVGSAHFPFYIITYLISHCLSRGD